MVSLDLFQFISKRKTYFSFGIELNKEILKNLKIVTALMASVARRTDVVNFLKNK